MPLPDISKLTVSELEKLVAICSTQIETRRKDKKKELAKQFRELAESEGLDLGDILGEPAKRPYSRKKKSAKKASGRRTKGVKVAPKYHNPKNKAEKWTGRGRKPSWVVAALDSGKTLESLLIKK